MGDANWEWTWIHSDHLHSATMHTNTDGVAIRHLASTSFGEQTENSGPGDDPKYTYTTPSTPLRTGSADATGLLYYGARYDDPVLCRFITPDTIYDRGPQGLNRYSYALNNPIVYRDPTGHQASPLHWMFHGLHDEKWKPAGVKIGNQMQAGLQGAALGATEGATIGAIIYTSMAVPGAGEFLDGVVLFPV